MSKVRSLLSLSAFALAALLLAWPAADSSAGFGVSVEDNGESSQDLASVDRIVTALKLAAWGREHSSPEVLLAAASMLSEGPASYVEMKKSESSVADSGPVEDRADKPRPGQITAAALLDEAGQMAAEQKLKHLSKHIAKDGDRLLPVVTRGSVGGPQMHASRLLSRSSHSYHFTFEGRKKASIAVLGDGETDLDMYIYDETGKLVGLSDTLWDNEMMYWRVEKATSYRVEVRNVGRVYNDYTIITN